MTWKDSGINTFSKMRGKKFGVWIFGNEFEQRAALVKYGMNPDKDVQIVKQNFDVNPFLKRQVDATSAMTYNELAQILESKNSKTGKQVQLSDLNVFKYNDLGTGMLQDGIFVRGDWIKDKANQATAVKFLEASFKGWAYCRDHYQECANIVVSKGTALPKGHQLWQVNEVNALIWPNKSGIGVMSPAAFKQTANIALQVQGHQEAGDVGCVPDGPGHEGRGGAQEAGRGRLRQELQKGQGRLEAGRQVDSLG